MWWLTFLLLLRLHPTFGSVYNVIPDDNPNTTCHHCHNLQHYLFNTTKYFTSNTQLFFLPGLHHLHTDLIIQNVHNISLIGSTTNGTTPDTVIQCNSSVGIIMANITNLKVTNITVRSCLGNEYNNATVLIKQCTNVQLRHAVIGESHNSYGIVGINILGDSHFSFITNNVLTIIYNDTVVDIDNTSLLIDQYHINDLEQFRQHRMSFSVFQTTYDVKIQLLNSIFQHIDNTTAMVMVRFTNKGTGRSTFQVKNCNFKNILLRDHLFNIYMDFSLDAKQGDSVHFKNCSFYNNHLMIIITVTNGPDIYISSCNFSNWHALKALMVSRQYIPLIKEMSLNLIIENTVFSSITPNNNLSSGVIGVIGAQLKLIGPVLFCNINHVPYIIFLRKGSVTCSNYVEFTSIQTYSIIAYRYGYHFNMLLNENTTIKVTNNHFLKFADIHKRALLVQNYPSCYFQYLSNTALDNNYTRANYNIVFENNHETSASHAYKEVSVAHCSWLPQSAFNTAMPLIVNQHYIKYISQSDHHDGILPQKDRLKTLCYCSTNSDFNCHKETLGPIYPGQTMTLDGYMNAISITGFRSYDTIITVVSDMDWLPPTTCHIINASEIVQIARSQTCTTVRYSIQFPTDTWCELFLKSTHDGTEKIDIYYINQKPCPAGFTNINGICQCCAFLKQYNIQCNINDQTLLRPADAWISRTLLSDHSYYYSVALQCPFHYCLPHSSHLNFSTPNSQCQFNRAGILCGYCEQGLSTVFGSSLCQRCSNIYLLLIVPIAIAGVVLVLLLFILNLTVTDGTINAFILYVNIISINTSLFFPKFTLAYIFISLANLDMGIQTCFYNGMDDYSKMWLQLTFPLYLVFIATSLIITSRYSTTIQRFTARRVLPVLATLFLLSYTKILRVVSSVLFSYSKIIRLPSEHARIVWSIDANVPLFSVKFAALFLACVVLFFTLLPFNMILLFTKTLSRFKFVTKFKPLLDAFQGPYKIKFYYWTGLQLIIRVVFYGISSLDRNINLTIGILLLSLIIGFEGVLRPFNTKYKNYQELSLMFNLHALFVISLYSHKSTSFINIMITLAALHLLLIITYHIVYYMCGGVMRSRKMTRMFTVTRWFTGLLRKQQDNRQVIAIQGNDLHNIPEVIFNYHNFREPLVGVDNTL